MTEDERSCADIRKRIFMTGYAGGMAHLASCFSSVEILYTLYRKGILRVDPKDTERKDRDRFVLSKGHAGLALYTVLSEAGFFDESELDTYLKPKSKLGGEPRRGELCGVEATTGALGHGLSFAVGLALAQKLDANGAKTYVLIGDGESEEGSIWEAATTAAAFGLSNLIVILDHNRLQKAATVEDTIGKARWKEKWQSFGWTVTETDGHDIAAIEECLKATPKEGPLLVIAHTVKGKGVSVMENNPAWHFRIPGKKDTRVFMKELGIEEGEMSLRKGKS